MVVSGVVPFTDIVPVFLSLVHIPALQRDHYFLLLYHTVLASAFFPL